MAIRTVVTRGFGNGTFSGTIALVVLRGYTSGVFLIDSRQFTPAGVSREFKPAARVDCVVPSSNRTFTPADE